MVTVHTNQEEDVVIKGGQICQVEFVLGGFMLAFPSYVLPLTFDNHQDDSFQGLKKG